MNGNGKLGSALIISYSYSGNTYHIAREIRDITGGDLCELYPREPYPMSFPELLEQVRGEISRGYRPRLLPVKFKAENYDAVFVGSPNWCGTIAPPLTAWLSRNSLAGKLVLPFSSHCGGVPGNMRRDIVKLCPDADVRETLSIINDGGTTLRSDILSWLDAQV